ncbi:hypothetical protein BDF21DRAFT_421701 [Thamnidium elegans]|nr:hypothetical protein BDF21DRAFT_421701 [Thamnidium elegans]
MSGDYNIKLIPEEESTSTRVCETMRIMAQKDFFLLENISFVYVICLTLYLQMNEYDFGQRTPVYIFRNYVMPFVLLYAMVFSLLAVAPFVILDQIDTPRDTYPTIKGIFKNTPLSVVCVHLMYCLPMINHVYSVLGPVYYYNDYYKNNQIGVLEAILGIIYLMAFILQIRVWLHFLTSIWTCLSNMVKMYRFANDRLKERSDTLV